MSFYPRGPRARRQQNPVLGALRVTTSDCGDSDWRLGRAVLDWAPRISYPEVRGDPTGTLPALPWVAVPARGILEAWCVWRQAA